MTSSFARALDDSLGPSGEAFVVPKPGRLRLRLRTGDGVIVYRISRCGDGYHLDPILGEPKRIGRIFWSSLALGPSDLFDLYEGDESALAIPASCVRVREGRGLTATNK